MPDPDTETLLRLLSDPSTPEEKLRPYFVLDDDTSGPFAPRFTLAPEVAAQAAAEGMRSALLLNSANWYERMRRQARFRERLAKGYKGPVIVSEGDSWFQYPITLVDTIDHLNDRYAIWSLDAAGDLLQNMADRQEYLPALRDTGASILLLSGGGNDLVAGGHLAEHLEDHDPAFSAADHLKPSFDRLLTEALAQYERIFRQVHGAFPEVRVLCHGYDYPIPAGGRWLGRPMEKRGISGRKMQAAIAQEMMDRFNRGLRRLVRTMPHVHYIDCRGVVGQGRWADELHPTNAGYGDVAGKFAAVIEGLAATPPGRTRAVSGAFGRAEALREALEEVPAQVAAAAGNAISLHVGLNRINPAHYAGSDGALAGCENDARAMERIARAQGFRTDILLSEAATREAVENAILKAAETLTPGGMFIYTVAAHGAYVPDWNGDEQDPEGTPQLDETTCLYDGQIVDDEYFLLWSKFKEGVRILVVADTCHSGRIVRAADFLNPEAPPPRVRQLPADVALRTVEQNLDDYRDRARTYAHVSEKVLSGPLAPAVKAQVLGLSACHETQTAADGGLNGAFTAALLKVWDGGRFGGDYRSFHRRITAELKDIGQTPQLDTRFAGTAFVEQGPFTLWTNPRSTVLRTGGTPADSAAPPDAGSAAAEGSGMDEAEPDDEAPVRAAARSSWPLMGEFAAFINGLGLKHFDAGEFVVMGGSHVTPGSAGFGKNTPPPKNLWPNIAATARVLDQLRDRTGRAITITNAYRSPAYNAAVGGESASLHMKFNAIDFKVSGMTTRDVAMALRWMRDREGRFKGGIGLYETFVHVDTRGHAATWPAGFAGMPLPSAPAGLAAAGVSQGGAPSPAPTVATGGAADRLSLAERIGKLAELVLKPLQRGEGIAAKMPRAFAVPVPRSGEEIDPMADTSANQQAVGASIGAASLLGFADSLTPGQKEDALLSVLFAQRAADAAHDPIAAREDWFRTYQETLGLLGWVREAAPFERKSALSQGSRFDVAVLNVIASIATGGQMAIVTAAIDALRGLASDDGRITLFDHQAQRAAGGCFQIGAAEARGDGLALSLGAFSFAHSRKKTNILFVDWGSETLDFWLAAQRMTLSETAYGDVRDLVKDRLAEARKALIADIPLKPR